MSAVVVSQPVTPGAKDSRKRGRLETSPGTASPTLSPPHSRYKMASEFADMLHSALEDERIKNKLSEIIGASLHEKIQEQQHEITELKKRVTELEVCKRAQESTLDDQEQYSRRDCVRIWTNEPEKNGEDTDAIVAAIATKMNVPLNPDEVCRSHRVGKKNGDKSRAIICRFISWRVKRRYMKGRPALKHTTIFISDDLTRKRSHLFYLARQKKKSHLCHSCWTFDGRIFLKMTEESEPVLVPDPAKLDELCPDQS